MKTKHYEPGTVLVCPNGHTYTVQRGERAWCYKQECSTYSKRTGSVYPAMVPIEGGTK